MNNGNLFSKYLKIYYELKALNTDKERFSSFFKEAQDASVKSTCGRKRVGAAIFYWPKDDTKVFKFKKGELLGTGYNGYKENSDETRYGKAVSKVTVTCADQYKFLSIDPNSDDGRAVHVIIMKEEIHAEDRAIQNVLKKYGEDGEELLKDSIIFTTLSPCENCANMISKYGITVGGWLQKYNRDGGKGVRQINKILIGSKTLEF